MLRSRDLAVVDCKIVCGAVPSTAPDAPVPLFDAGL